MSKSDQEQPQQRKHDFSPFADDGAVLGIGNLDIDNAPDRVTLTGDVVLTRDQQGLRLARQLQAVLNSVVHALEADHQLPEQVEVRPVATVKNPLA